MENASKIVSLRLIICAVLVKTFSYENYSTLRNNTSDTKHAPASSSVKINARLEIL